MTDVLTGEAAEWRAVWRARIAQLCWTQAQVDRRAQDDAEASAERWGEGYCAKLLCGDRVPTAPTIARMNRVLGIRLHVQDDAIMP